MQYEKDLSSRLLDFSENIIRFIYTFSNKKEHDVLKYQLSKSATAIGANYEESQSTSYKEFVQKTRIALREAKETLYWLKVIDRLKLGNSNHRDKLLAEVKEITLILGSIVSQAHKKLKS